MIRKGQLSEENMPAYKQFMALAGQLCLKTRRASFSIKLATEPVSILWIAYSSFTLFVEFSNVQTLCNIKVISGNKITTRVVLT